MLRRTAASIHRLGKIEARLLGPGRVSATPAAIAAALSVASRRNNISMRHRLSVTTLPSVRIAVAEAVAAVLTVAAVEARLLPAVAEEVVAVAAQEPETRVRIYRRMAKK